MPLLPTGAYTLAPHCLFSLRSHRSPHWQLLLHLQPSMYSFNTPGSSHQVPAPTLHAGLCSPLTTLCHNVTHTPSLYSPQAVFLFFLIQHLIFFLQAPSPYPHPHRVQQELLKGGDWFCFLTVSSAPATALTKVLVNTSHQFNMQQSELWENTSGDLSLAFYIHYTEIISL